MYTTGQFVSNIFAEYKQQDTTFHNLFISVSSVRRCTSRRMRWTGHVARMGEERGLYMVLVGKPEGKRPLGRRRCRWVDNIRMDLQEVGCIV